MKHKQLQSTSLPASEGGKSPLVKPGWWALSGLLVIMGFAVVPIVKYRAQIFGAWKLATARQSEPFTELYFSDYLNAPKHFEAGQLYSISFTISNQETTAKTYPYVISYNENGQVTQLKQNAVLVARGQKQIVTESFVAPKTANSIMLNIELLEQSESLHMRLTP